MILSGWGRFPRADCHLFEARSDADVLDALETQSSLIARGAGRAYGDAALNRSATLSLTKLNRFLAFDEDTGELHCQAGVMLSDVIDVFLPRGWFPPVTPGTKFVTIGGMIAADVHGKNHHKDGSFGQHVLSLDLALADGRVVRCSPVDNAELFDATIGGMGLTGVILAARFRLRAVETDRIEQQTLCFPCLSDLLDAFEATGDSTYSVAWVDCTATGADLGRSILYLGEHVRAEALPKGAQRYRPSRVRSKRLPCDLPRGTINGATVRAFNALYRWTARPGVGTVGLEPYFYPLDRLADWNRIYGAPGFVQHQCVLPKAAAGEGLRDLLEQVSRNGTGSFLAVLKLFGPAGRGLMSFPMEGYTLTLDFPVTAANLKLLDELDAVARACGGRPYLAKDARADAALIETGYPRLPAFAAVRDRFDPERRFTSLQSERLGL